MERLLDYFTPENYQLTLNINKQTERIRGKAIITGRPTASTIKLHAKNLKISSVSVNDTPVAFDYDGEMLSFAIRAGFDENNARPNSRPSFAGHTEPGKASLSADDTNAIKIEISYSFNINRNMEGAYLSTYQYHGREEKLVTTQFESHYARQCFPCVDEPAAKATFDLKIISHDPADTIISNMPAKAERIREVPTFNLEASTLDTKNTTKQKIVEFETTPRMSTYLLAFCVGHFKSKIAETSHGVKVTTYCVLNQSSSLLDFPTTIAVEALDYYDQLFGQPYPLPKLDQIAIPDFEAGAMENWGLVTYRESCVLAGKSTPQTTKEYIATVITHELSHQWFGNLVTMSWWDDLWLNESFANVMEYISVEDLHPDWHIMEDFFTGECYPALKRDSLPGVQAVHQAVENPEEIATLFDGAIVYAKGSHLIFMLMRLMGRRAFFAGIKDYFKFHKYGNTTGDDLWAALQPHAKFNVKDFMNAWISQPGYPVITDEQQQRFLITGDTDDTKWPLPKVTDDLSGHYLINLSDTEFAKKIAKFDRLSLEQRLRLLIDRELLSKVKLVETASLMDLLPKFQDETSAPIWEILATILDNLGIFALPDTEYHQPYQAYIMTVISVQLQRLGIRPRSGEDPNDTKLRKIILAFALYARDPQTIKRLAQEYNSNYLAIHPEIRRSVVAAQFWATDEQIFDQLLADYQTTSDPSIRSVLRGVIADAEQPSHVTRLLELLEEPEIIRPQDHIFHFADLLSNHKTKSATFDWLYAHWDYIESLTGEKTLSDYVKVAAARIYNSSEAEAFYHFFDRKASQPALSRAIAVAHTDISARLRWIREDSPEVHARLLS